MRYPYAIVAAAFAAFLLAGAASLSGGGGVSATHESSSWEIVLPTVMGPDFDAAARATATAWVEGCRTSGWTNANCLQPKVPFATGTPRADAADFDAAGATIEFVAGEATNLILYRFVRPHPAAATPAATPTPAPAGVTLDCLNGIASDLACQNLRTSGGGGPFVLVCQPDATYFRIRGGALQWTLGSVKGLRAAYGDDFALAEVCEQ